MTPIPTAVVEDIAVAIYAAVYGDAADGYPDPEGEGWWMARASEVLIAALSSCPILGLTAGEISALITRTVGSPATERLPDYRADVESARSKLLATREALERGGDA